MQGQELAGEPGKDPWLGELTAAGCCRVASLLLELP